MIADNVATKEESDFQKNFNIAKQHLSQRQVNEALPYLQYLNKKYPENANLKYLIGVCYAELAIVNPVTIQLLSEASSKASLEYDPNSLDEERVPIYVYYYLSVAYSQNKQCEKAEKFRNTFMAVYPHNDNYYIDESQRWINSCYELETVPKETPIPEFPKFKPYVSKPKIVLSNKEIKNSQEYPEIKIIKDSTPKTAFKKLTTKRVDYTTQSPLYGVQLGAFKEIISVSRFKNLHNVEVFIDKQGWIRYVVGHFSIYGQAESLLALIKTQGYPDAFVVNVNNEKKYSEEVISVDNVNLRAKKFDNLAYAVQIGAFNEKFSKKEAELYITFEGIKEIKNDSTTYLYFGKYKEYAEAKKFAEEVKQKGIPDAFVIAISRGRKVGLKQAMDNN